MAMRWLVAWLWLALALAAPARALTPAEAGALATGDIEARIVALGQVLAGQPDARTVALIQALSEDAVKSDASTVFILRDDKAFDAVTGAEVALPASAEDVINNNRMRGELDAALALLRLSSADDTVRLEAARTLAAEPDEARLPLIEKAWAAERVPAIREALAQLRHALLLGSADRGKRLEAAQALGASGTPATKTLLLERRKDETDAEVQAALDRALARIESRLVWGERAGVVFTGLSLGSILLLVALGLAITSTRASSASASAIASLNLRGGEL